MSSQIENKRLRLLQVWNFYESAIKQLYKRSPDLAKQPFKSQMSETIADGFGAVNIIAPYLNLLNYESHLIVTNNKNSQAMWLAENGLPHSFEGNWVDEISRLQINTMKPDVLYVHPLGHDSRFMRTLAWQPPLILGLCASDIPTSADWTAFDVILSPLAGVRRQAIRQGAKAAEFFHAGCPEWLNAQTARIEPIFDIVFCGSWSLKQHIKRNHYLEVVAGAAIEQGFSCGYYLSGQLETLTRNVSRFQIEPRFGMGMYQALRSGRIVLDARGAIRSLLGQTGKDIAGKETANMRIFETTSIGAFLLTEYADNLSQWFEPGVEIETFGNESELLDKVCHYLAHPEQRQRIAQRGYERCLRDYSMSVMAQKFDSIVRKHLALKTAPQKPANELPLAEFPPGVTPAPPVLPIRPVLPVSHASNSRRAFSQPISASQLTTLNTASIEPDWHSLYAASHIGKNVQIIGLTNVEIGANSVIGDNCWLNVCVRDDRIRMKIGQHVLVGRDAVISTAGYLEIADFCVLAPRVYVSDADHRFENITLPVMNQGITAGRSVIIEENCWLGINAVVTGNLTVGRGSVVAANSVVTSDVPPFAVVAGAPARVIKLYHFVSNQWERVESLRHLEMLLQQRTVAVLPSREEYRAILQKHSPQIPPIVAGGESI